MRFGATLLLVCLGACSRTPESTRAKGADTTESCEDLFRPPASAKKLCDEHVLGNDAEIHWQSYAHVDDRHALWPPYQARASTCGASFTFKPPLLNVADKGKRLELFEASGGGYPTCSVAPSPEHKTVVIVSEKHDRGK